VARIKNEDRQCSPQFTAIHNISHLNGETNDCTVKALALVTGCTYDEALVALAKHGRQKRKGCYMGTQRQALSDLGFNMVQVDFRARFVNNYPGVHAKLKGATTHHMKRFNKVWSDGKTYYVYTRRHVAAVVNGVNLDWTVGRAKRVVAVYEIIKK
jgi:hypothetical protein